MAYQCVWCGYVPIHSLPCDCPKCDRYLNLELMHNIKPEFRDISCVWCNYKGTIKIPGECPNCRTYLTVIIHD
jgi:primosomal protein N'